MVILAGCKACKRTLTVYESTPVEECCGADMVGVVQCDVCLRKAAMPIDGRWSVDLRHAPYRHECPKCKEAA
jgi:hypothetical protein